MKATLEFNMPDDDYDFNNALNGAKYRGALEAFANILRNKIKYETNLSDDEVRIYEEIQDSFFQCMNEEKISLFD